MPPSVATSTVQRRKDSRVSRMSDRHGGGVGGGVAVDAVDASSVASMSMLTRNTSNHSLGSLSQDEYTAMTGNKSNKTRNTSKSGRSGVKKSFSFKKIKKSLNGAANFGGLNTCKGGAKMRFSKVMSNPELDGISIATDSGDTAYSSLQTDQTTLAEQEAAARVPVPWHTCGLIACLAAFFFANLPSLKSLDEVANIDTFTRTNFDSVPLAVVIMVRLIFAAIMLGNAASVFLYGCWNADTDYFPGSKLKVVKRIPFRGAFHPEGSWFGGIKCISTFTLWCWIVEGTAFFLAGMIPLFHFVPNTTINPWFMRIAIVLWTVGASVSILVSAVVKYALWPMAMEHGENVKLLKAPGALLQHNLNSIAALAEVGLLGGLPVRMCDFAFPPTYGIIYLMYTYAMMYSWTDKRHGPQFFYPFFDTTLGATTSLALVALLTVLTMSFYIFVGAEHLLMEAEKYIFIVPIAAIVLLSMSVCRVKD